VPATNAQSHRRRSKRDVEMIEKPAKKKKQRQWKKKQKYHRKGKKKVRQEAMVWRVKETFISVGGPKTPRQEYEPSKAQQKNAN